MVGLLECGLRALNTDSVEVHTPVVAHAGVVYDDLVLLAAGRRGCGRCWSWCWGWVQGWIDAGNLLVIVDEPRWAFDAA